MSHGALQAVSAFLDVLQSSIAAAMEHVKYVICDLDGTLLDTGKFHLRWDFDARPLARMSGTPSASSTACWSGSESAQLLATHCA